MAESSLEGRHRRTNPKRRREEIYCYDVEDRLKAKTEELDSEEVEAVSEEDEDDSFIYGSLRGRKSYLKKRKLKSKFGKNATTYKFPKQRNTKKYTKPYYVEYVYSFANKIKIYLKIFNPDSYMYKNLLKGQYEKELYYIYQQFGRRIPKLYYNYTANRWKYLLKQVEYAGKDFAQYREERIKLKRKVAKFSQNTYSRLEFIRYQKYKDEERKVRRQSLEIMRKVQRYYWGSAIKIRKIVNYQSKSKLYRYNKLKKLYYLVAKQFEASQKITTILYGYKYVSFENVQVSQNTRVPVVIDVRRTPKCEYLGLHEDNIIRPSLLIKFPLREYQLLGVYWISTLQSRGMNAILADEMGLGKTIQTIALLAHLAIYRGIWGPHLVIVPTTILVNWYIEFKRWCPAFKIMTYFGSTKYRKQKRKGWSKLNSFHVCITTYKISVADHPIFRRKRWYYMILDEAHNIKNFKSQRWQTLLNFNAHSRLLLTGTPLQNDLTELWSLLHFLMPKIFNSFDDFNEWFNIPFQYALYKNFPISQYILKKLHTVLRPFFLRRLKKDVETQLPHKTECIIRCSMSRRQRYLYDEMIWHYNRRQKTNESTGMMNVLMGLKKICNHPDLFQPRIEETPLNWVPLTIVIAHHMFLKLHFEIFCTPILKDFVDNFQAKFEYVAYDILRKYVGTLITNDNRMYYKHKFADRLAFAKINYERSKRKEFVVYSFPFDRMHIAQKDIPLYLTSTISGRAKYFEPIFDKYLFVVPKVMARPAHLATFPMSSEVQAYTNRLYYLRNYIKHMIPPYIESIRNRFLLNFPSKKIILYDSGKLIKMILLLKAIKYRGQKALIFTQMTRMLDIFEKVLNMFKFNYVRLDGNTKTELRQTYVYRFNNDPRVLCFISSTRSGGIGLNLTGANNVIFYYTDWNPAMDKQAQDRCHRIGQTMNVTIYRLITYFSIYENILMKSIQKRKLESLVTEEGMFDTSYFEKVSLKGLLEGAIDYRKDQDVDLAYVEDDEDRQMLQNAYRERKDIKEYYQEELDIDMLPPLFKYGLKMLDNAEIVDSINNQMSYEDYEQEYVEQYYASAHKEYDPEEYKLNYQQYPYYEQKDKGCYDSIDYVEPFYSMVASYDEDNHTYKISTLEKLKAMSIYQSQYLYMKKHFYQQYTEPTFPEPTQDQPKNKKLPRDKRRKSKKKR